MSFLTITNRIVIVLFILIMAAPAKADPRVWIDARLQVLFDRSGRITSVNHIWIFDEAYSSFAVQGFEKNGGLASKNDLAPLAETNVLSLKEYNYFTSIDVDGENIDVRTPIEYSLEEQEDRRIVLKFNLPLSRTVQAGAAFTIKVEDPSSIADISFFKNKPVTLVDAPAGCLVNVIGPKHSGETPRAPKAIISCP